jgi:mono/diheme cytochrome c family protein
MIHLPRGAEFVVAATLLAACQGATSAPAPSPAERGKYLVTAIGGCNDCHTPMKPGSTDLAPDMSRMLSGHPADVALPPPPALPPGPWLAVDALPGTAYSGPWGVSFAANLTPDEETGIGAWDENVFIRTLRTGKHLGAGRDLLPPMPWQTFGQMTDDDLKAIFAYLRTIPPIKNKVPDPVPPPGAPPRG